MWCTVPAGLQAARLVAGGHVDDRAGTAAGHREPGTVGVLAAELHAEHPGEHLRGRVEQPLGHRHRVQPAHGVLGGHPGHAVPTRAGIAGRGDQIDHQSVRVAEAQHLLAVAVARRLGVHVQTGQSPLPPAQ